MSSSSYLRSAVGGKIKGVCAIFVPNSLESKSLFGSMLKKHNTGGRIKGMDASFLLKGHPLLQT